MKRLSHPNSTLLSRETLTTKVEVTDLFDGRSDEEKRDGGFVSRVTEAELQTAGRETPDMREYVEQPFRQCLR